MRALSTRPSSATSLPARPSPTVVVQAKCACQTGNDPQQECETCQDGGKQVPLQTWSLAAGGGDSLEQEADAAADHVLQGTALGAPLGIHHSALTAVGPRLSRRATSGRTMTPSSVPDSVHSALRSGGAPLPAGVAGPLGERFGHDFSQITIHQGSAAIRSARAVNALAYTVGSHIVFDQDQFNPYSAAGRRLLAHELAHVIQQSAAPGATLQRQARPRPAPVDERAQLIIDAAQDSTQPLQQRAINSVRSLINTYYSAQSSKISQIRYEAAEHGLGITFNGSGAATTGIVTVGDYFVQNVTRGHFARRVAQVGHELEHVDQQRSGMGGHDRQDEREFQAFYHEALFQEPEGTGRMQHSTRVMLIDAALGYFFCLSAELQRDNAGRRDELTARRVEAVRRSGNADTIGEAPSSCGRQGH